MGFIKAVNKYRNALMGFAILWVMLFHTNIVLGNPVLHIIKVTGYGGVDIFMLLSGIGLYYSLEKNPSVLAFYKRRMTRLLPSYLPFLLFWYAAEFFMATEKITNPVRELLGNIFMTGWISGQERQFNWYVQTIVWFYFLTPAIYACIKGSRRSRIKDIVLLFLLCLQGVPFFGHRVLMGISRLPIFILGMLLADRASEKKEDAPGERGITVKAELCLYVLTLAGVAFLSCQSDTALWTYGMWWYPFLLITPGLCLMSGRIFGILERYKITARVVRILEQIGKSSFEIYLIHIAIFDWINRAAATESRLKWAVAYFSALLLGMLYRKMVDQCEKVWNKKRRKL